MPAAGGDDRLLARLRRRGLTLGLAEQPRQRQIERRLHHDAVLMRDDHARQLGNASGLRAQVQRPHVDQRSFDRNHHQRALDHLRALLVPERDLRRDHLVLVDARDHLLRTEHQRLLRELEDLQLAVMLAVASRHHPRREVVAAPRRERQHLDELRVLFAGQLHHRVVRRHALALAAAVDGRRFPLIFLVVEDRRVGHVIRRVDRRLNREDVFGVAHVLPQIRGHLGERLQQVRKDLRERLHNRVGGLRGVERHRALIRVDHDLDGVADVIHAGPPTRSTDSDP